MRDVAIKAEKDLVIDDAGIPVLERVTRVIRLAVVTKKREYVTQHVQRSEREMR